MFVPAHPSNLPVLRFTKKFYKGIATGTSCDLLVFYKFSIFSTDCWMHYLSWWPCLITIKHAGVTEVTATPPLSTTKLNLDVMHLLKRTG